MKINVKYNYKEKKEIRTYLLCPYLSLIFQTMGKNYKTLFSNKNRTWEVLSVYYAKKIKTEQQKIYWS